MVAALQLAQTTPEGRARNALIAALFQEPDWAPGLEPPAPLDFDKQQAAEIQNLLSILFFTVLGRFDLEQNAGGNPRRTPVSTMDSCCCVPDACSRSPRCTARPGSTSSADLRQLNLTANVAADPVALRWTNQNLALTGDAWALPGAHAPHDGRPARAGPARGRVPRGTWCTPASAASWLRRTPIRSGPLRAASRARGPRKNRRRRAGGGSLVRGSGNGSYEPIEMPSRIEAASSMWRSNIAWSEANTTTTTFWPPGRVDDDEPRRLVLRQPDELPAGGPAEPDERDELGRIGRAGHPDGRVDVEVHLLAGQPGDGHRCSAAGGQARSRGHGIGDRAGGRGDTRLRAQLARMVHQGAIREELEGHRPLVLLDGEGQQPVLTADGPARRWRALERELEGCGRRACRRRRRGGRWSGRARRGARGQGRKRRRKGGRPDDLGRLEVHVGLLPGDCRTA